MFIRDRLVSDKTLSTLCYYVNPTNKIQLIRVIEKHHLYLEKIVFPQQRILFEAMPEAQLEIYSSQADEIETRQTIYCNNLKIN